MLAKVRQLGIIGRIVVVSLAVSLGAGVCLWLLIRRDIANGAISAATASDVRLAIWIAAGFAALVVAVVLVVAISVRGLTSQAEQHEFDALHDPLTGLPNRTLFNDRIEQCVRERTRSAQSAALMLVDLDRFKEVNDTLGHAAGDELLKEVARRLSSRLRRSDTVARLGGDEFGVLLPIVDGVAGTRKVVEAIRKSLTAPLAIDGQPVTVDGSIGVAMIDGQDEELDVLMQRADTVMYRAKRGRLGYAIYDHEVDGGERDQLALVGDLRIGIPRGELRLFYQPKAEVDSRRIRSVEALVRWQHPKRGLLAPNVFVPLAEQNGLIRHLTFWVLDEAMRQAREWAERGHGLKVAVNLSQESLLDAAMPAEITRVLERHRVPSKALEIEITESALVSDLAAANAALSELSEMGIALSIDDYGTGYSSLAHVRGLPVDCIKIDRSYVSGMLVDQKNATIVRSTIDLARDLGIGVVAEGVETMDEWDALRELGCHTAQGYLISKPRPAKELLEWLVATGSQFRMDAKYEASKPLPNFV
jgi:diguanylate cyclase (GGDEF)-like protein